MIRETTLKNSGKIELYNVPKNCCSHEYCGKHASYHANLDFQGFPIYLLFCKKHYEEFEKIYYKSEG